ISESALAAAIWPYENGSSTIGVKKSTVCTSARWRSKRYTPASSNVFELTSTFLLNEMGSCGKTCRRACWLNLDAHPAHDESDVSLRICSRDIVIHPLSLVCHSERSRGIPMIHFLVEPRDPWTSLRFAQDDEKRFGGEDRNLTYLDTRVTTTVLKTARATRHPSLSGKKKTPNVQRRTSNSQPSALSVEHL